MRTRTRAAVDATETRQPRVALSKVDVAGGFAFLLLSIVISLRLNKGADFSDEGYYALFVDDWLKGGIDSSAYLVLHVTAALVVFPFAWLYVHVTGSSDGLFLSLRYLYLVGSVLASALVIVLLRRLDLGARSWLGGLLVLAFIPFGLPTPSYNTIGLQSLCISLAAYGCGARAARHQSADAWFAVSAVAWAVAVIAYPPMILAAFLLAFLLVMHRNDRRLSVWRYLVMLVVAQVAGWVLVTTVTSISWLSMSLHYTSVLAPPGGLPAKLGRGVDLLVDNGWFALLCIAAVAVGLARRRLSSTVATCAVAGLVALSFIQPPTLFVRSHDVVTLVALTGVGVMWDLRPRADPTPRLLAILFTVSLAAGVTTMLFATNLVFNFCIGAAFAAALAIAFPGTRSGSNRRDLVSAVAGLCVIGAVLSTSLRFFYGDSTTPHQERHRIAEGFFAGIQAGPDDVRLLEIVRHQISPLVQDHTWVVYIGRNPGVMLATPARLQMLSSWPFIAPASPRALAENADFYSSSSHRPTTVIIYRDRFFEPVNPIGPRFQEWYSLSRTQETPLGVMEIYRLR